MSDEILRNKPQRGDEAERWMAIEIAEQRERYNKIEHAMNVELADQREGWIAEFNERLQTRGFNWHADNLRKIKPEEIYPKPDRDFKVVY